MKKWDIDLDQLTVLFVGLKLTGNIHWPWWKVILPSIISIILKRGFNK